MTTVQLTIADGIAEIVLDRPERLNAINPALLSDFAAAIRSAQGQPVILLRGAGRAFCAATISRNSKASHAVRPKPGISSRRSRTSPGC